MSESVPGGKCPNCGEPLSSLGVEEFRVGGTTGGWKLLFGEWAELGESMLALEILACRACRRVEFRVPTPGQGPNGGQFPDVEASPGGTPWNPLKGPPSS